MVLLCQWCRTFATNNTHEQFGKFQFGSTFWSAASHVTGHIASSDKDLTQLGCWVSCSLQVHSAKILIIIFAYCPCLNITAHIRSVYTQHCRYFAQLHQYTCPCTAFLEDLESFIRSHRDAGEAILLFGDMNGDIKHPILDNFMNSVELHELILLRFPHLPPPATFLHGAQSGKILIDSVWASDNVMVTVASWHSTNLSPGDHQAITVDVNLVDCISKPHCSIAHPPSQRLSSTLPSAQQCYLMYLNEFAAQHKLPQKLESLFQSAASPPTCLKNNYNKPWSPLTRLKWKE